MNHRESGFSLVEVLIALFLLAIGLLAVAPLYAYGVRMAAASGDLGTVDARAVNRMEVLRATGFGSLAAGGSLTSNAAGFFDTSDPDVIVRWTIADNATPATLKTITVRAQATRRAAGLQKEITLTTRRGQ
jgi:prepilin-type N-terminal cleavage/methylation domain-containing protein